MAYNDSTNLATEAVIKAYLTIQPAETKYDGGLEYIANGVMGSFNQYTGRTLVRKAPVSNSTYTYWDSYYTGDGSQKLYLTHYPVTQIDALYLDSERVFDGEDKKSDAVIHTETGLIQLVENEFPDAVKSVRVKYLGGYVLSASLAFGYISDDLLPLPPDDLVQAYLLQCKVAFEGWKSNQDRIAQQSIAADSQSLIEIMPFHPEVKSVLKRYKRWGESGLVSETLEELVLVEG